VDDEGLDEMTEQPHEERQQKKVVGTMFGYHTESGAVQTPNTGRLIGKPEMADDVLQAKPIELVDPAPLAVVPAGDNVDRLLELALTKGVDVAALEKLVELHERVSAKAAEREFNEALSQFQATCPAIKKEVMVNYVSKKTGARVKYNYATLDEIARVVAPLLSRYGLSYGWSCNVDAGHLTSTCRLRHRNGHSEEASFPVPTESKVGMSAQQMVASALTYARRYSLIQVLGLTTTDEDTDGAELTPEDLTTITEEQQNTINDLLVATGTDKLNARARFNKWLSSIHGTEVMKLAEIQARHYDTIVRELKTKLEKQRKNPEEPTP
jgi:hypothetical protein